jgi:hypothetical protein
MNVPNGRIRRPKSADVEGDGQRQAGQPVALGPTDSRRAPVEAGGGLRIAQHRFQCGQVAVDIGPPPGRQRAAVLP